MRSDGLELACLALFPNLYTIDGVLPKNVATRSYRGQGREVHESDPNGKARVLLSQGLTSLDGPVKETAHRTAHGKLNDADEEARESDGEKKGKVV